ncbi:unnamed protein product [Rotaria sordida]|uniref:Uncharacterized protein n=1 Tax=Rotaria sordida TaxID=392033 RepID=A0A815EGV4_9BILA|nr:unnamed protein product [Rotaria sordida]CAF1309988.1 unnamed protein product [Rotaria sordida]CAF1387818.1 unnamed protein product [Rotaria sordida]CAF1579818.1 unnamed protein product [Rotaria sordida]CAF1579876.1 unnamed protein product [Rotaria sordida]
MRLTDQSSTLINKDNNKNKYFITKTAYLSVELNPHNLLYLILLVKQKQLPKESLNIYLSNSQSCEAMFRNTRSLSGAYSTIINFTVHKFLQRTRKLAILNKIRCHELIRQDDGNILFPIHHKHKIDNDLLAVSNLDDIGYFDIEQIIFESYDASIKLIENLGISTLLKKHRIYELEQLSKFIFNELNSKSKTFDNSARTTNNNDDDDNTSCDDDNYKSENNDDENNDNDNISDNDDDNVSDNEEDETIQSTKTIFFGIHIKDKISPYLVNSYFKLKINNIIKYLHEQSALWLLPEKTDRPSIDRFSRVMQSSKIE